MFKQTRTTVLYVQRVYLYVQSSKRAARSVRDNYIPYNYKYIHIKIFIHIHFLYQLINRLIMCCSIYNITICITHVVTDLIIQNNLTYRAYKALAKSTDNNKETLVGYNYPKIFIYTPSNYSPPPPAPLGGPGANCWQSRFSALEQPMLYVNVVRIQTSPELQSYMVAAMPSTQRNNSYMTADLMERPHFKYRSLETG